MHREQPSVDAGCRVGDGIQDELAEIARRLLELSARIDAAGTSSSIGDGLAAMSLDQASQAVHYALLEIQGCLTPV